MSLDITFTQVQPTKVFSANITHNLVRMADAAGIYGVVWRPEENGIRRACDMIPCLESGIAKMKENPELFRTFDPGNKWGSYDDFLPWLEKLLEACREFPNAKVSSCR